MRSRFLDRGAIVGLHRPEDGALVVLLHILDDRDGVIGIELGREIRDLVRLERIEQLLAHPIVHLRQHVAVEQLGKCCGERAARIGRGKLEQIRDVGRVERRHEQPRALDVAAFHAIDHGIDELRGQSILGVVARLGGRGRIDQSIGFSFAHRLSVAQRPPPSRRGQRRCQPSAGAIIRRSEGPRRWAVRRASAI
jgi:hypothetical protein